MLRAVADIEPSGVFRRNKGNVNIKCGRGRYLAIPFIKNSTAPHSWNHHTDIERFVIREYKHGGILGKLLGNIFCDGNRPLHELSVNEIAFQKGIPCAEVIAITKKKIWGMFYKAAFITKEIPDADDLVQFLQTSSLEYLQRSKKSIMGAVAHSIRKMHDTGIYHADLHLKNILLKKEPTGGFRAYIIDMDKSVIFNKLTIDQRMNNLLRLNRSFEKLRWLLTGATSKFQRYASGGKITHTTGEETVRETMNQKLDLISQSDKVRFFKGYMLYHQPLDKDWKRYIRQYYSRHFTHKLWWHVLEIFSK